MEVSLFSGKHKCAGCGAFLAYTQKQRKNGTVATYRCSRYNNNGSRVCTPHSIDENLLIQAVLHDIRKHAQLAIADRKRLEKRLLDKVQRSQNAEVHILQSKQKKAENRLSVVQRAMKELYEDKISGLLTAEMFRQLMQDYVQE